MYLSSARQRIENLERLLAADQVERDPSRDSGWDAESLRDELRQGEVVFGQRRRTRHNHSMW